MKDKIEKLIGIYRKHGYAPKAPNDATGAVTLAFKGQLSGGNPTAGNWTIETGLGKLFAIKLYNTP